MLVDLSAFFKKFVGLDKTYELMFIRDYNTMTSEDPSPAI
jgi:hypothetical protein